MSTEPDTIINRGRSITGKSDTKIVHENIENAPEHQLWLLQDYPTEQNNETLHNHPQVHDLAPSDSFFLPFLKKGVAGGRFSVLSALGIALFQCLNPLSQTDFQRTFSDWVERMCECIQIAGMFF